MKTKDNSLSSQILKFIEIQFNKDKEFFKEGFNRRKFKNQVLDELGMNDKKGRNLYSYVYTKFLKRKKKYNDEYAHIKKLPTPKNSEINATTTAQPSGMTIEPRKTEVEKIKEEIQVEHPQLDSSDKEEMDFDLEHFEQASHLIPVESISIFWDGVWQLMKLKWSMIERFTQQERESLGMMWQPFFEKHTSEKFVLLGIPLIMTFGIFAGKIREGIRLKRERKLREEKKEKSE